MSHNESLKCKLAKGEMKGNLQMSPYIFYCLYLTDSFTLAYVAEI